MNKLILKDSKGKDEYRIIFDIETENDKKYIIYTKDEEVKTDLIKAYSSIYKFNKRTKKYTISSIRSQKELEFVDKVLNSLQNESES